MGFLDLFVIREETIQEKQKTGDKKIVEKQVISTPVFSSEQFPKEGTFKQELYDSLVKKLETTKTVDGNYMEYLSALKAMNSIAIDDDTKIKTVFATLSTKGLTPESVLLSTDHYLKAIENEKESFIEEAKQKRTLLVDGKQDEIKANDDLIKQKSDQIVQLTTEITDLQKINNEIKSSIEQAEQKITSGEGSFGITINAIIDEINKNVNKIKTLFNIK